MEENMIVIRDPKTFCVNFDWSKYVDKNLKHGIEFIIRTMNLQIRIKKIEIEQLQLKYKHVKNIYEHRKQQNK